MRPTIKLLWPILGLTFKQLLGCVKARVQNLMINGIQILVRMPFIKSLILQQSPKYFESRCNSPSIKIWFKNFLNFCLLMRKFARTYNCQFRTRFCSFTKKVLADVQSKFLCYLYPSSSMVYTILQNKRWR